MAVKYLENHNGSKIFFSDLERDGLLIEDPEWTDKLQTSTGYGRKLKTKYSIKHKGKTHKIFCCFIQLNII